MAISTKKLINARRLRKTQTDAERRLWSRLRNRTLGGRKFRRQYVVGPYTCDFVCIEKNLIIEIDGGQHAHQLEKDENRTAYLRSHRFTVMRFWNHEALAETEAVLEKILAAIESDAPSPCPSPPQGRGNAGMKDY
jgi:very-short-patch-repair endonuclease